MKHDIANTKFVPEIYRCPHKDKAFECDITRERYHLCLANFKQITIQEGSVGTLIQKLREAKIAKDQSIYTKMVILMHYNEILKPLMNKITLTNYLRLRKKEANDVIKEFDTLNNFRNLLGHSHTSPVVDQINEQLDRLKLILGYLRIKIVKF